CRAVAGPESTSVPGRWAPARQNAVRRPRSPGGWADNRRTRKFLSSRVADSHTWAGQPRWGAWPTPSPRSPGRGSRGFAARKRLAPEIFKIAVSEDLAVNPG